MRTLRSRFILSHLLPILVVIPLVGIGLVYLLETQILLSDLSQDVEERARVIADAVNSQPEIWDNPDRASAFVAGMGVLVSGRLYLLDANGALLATNDPELLPGSGGQPGVDLEGIDTALAGKSSVLVFYGFAEQRGEALVPVRNVNEDLVGIVAVTDTLQGLATGFGQLRWLVIITLLVELVLSIILALILAERLARPITAVTKAVAEIAEGQRIEPVLEEGPQEIQEMAASVNLLAGRLRSLEETRRHLLANLVHELGRPLGALRAAIHTLRVGAAEDPAIRAELLGGMEDEVKRMQPLLDDLAQLHGQVLGTLELNRQALPLSDWLPSAILPWRAAALDKGLQWQANIPANLPTVALDPDRIGQVIGNLLSNAIKYTPKGGQVAFAAGANEKAIWFEVADTGPGIVPEEQEKIFEPFFRSTKQRRFPQGLGLGLTIARDLVEAHGGTLEIDSQPGQGSRFIARLPLNGS